MTGGTPPWRAWADAVALYALVGLGSLIGGVLRALASVGAVALVGPSFPWGTLFVNVAGSFAIGILAALNDRHRTGRGRHIVASLFENTVILVAQHMAQHAITGQPLKPMSVRVATWGVYDIIATADGEKVFVGVVTDTQWAVFCREFGFADLAADARIASNTGRVQNRAWLIPELQRRLGVFDKAALSARFEAMGLPFAPITRPEELFEDPHLNASGGLLPVSLPDGRVARLPALPIAIDGARPPLRRDAPKVGEHGREVLAEAGLASAEIDTLVAEGVVRIGEGWR